MNNITLLVTHGHKPPPKKGVKNKLFLAIIDSAALYTHKSILYLENDLDTYINIILELIALRKHYAHADKVII